MYEVSIKSWDSYAKLCSCFQIKLDILAIVDRWNMIQQDKDLKIEKKRLKNPQKMFKEHAQQFINFNNLSDTQVRAALLLDTFSRQQLYNWIAYNAFHPNMDFMHQRITRQAHEELCTRLGFDPIKSIKKQTPSDGK